MNLYNVQLSNVTGGTKPLWGKVKNLSGSQLGMRTNFAAFSKQNKHPPQQLPGMMLGGEITNTPATCMCEQGAPQIITSTQLMSIYVRRVFLRSSGLWQTPDKSPSLNVNYLGLVFYFITTIVQGKTSDLVQLHGNLLIQEAVCVVLAIPTNTKF